MAQTKPKHIDKKASKQTCKVVVVEQPNTKSQLLLIHSILIKKKFASFSLFPCYRINGVLKGETGVCELCRATANMR